MSDVGVHPIREVDRSRSPRKCEHLPLGRERVDLVGIEVDLQRREELARIGNVALPVDELPQPLEALIVGVGSDAALLVLPVRRDAALGDEIHFRCGSTSNGCAASPITVVWSDLVEVGLRIAM